MMKKVQEEDQDNFLSLMNVLLSVSYELKSNIKRTPNIKRTQVRHLPPNSTNIKKSDSVVTKKIEKPMNFRIKSRSNFQTSLY